jgi:hypothetical protein
MVNMHGELKVEDFKILWNTQMWVGNKDKLKDHMHKNLSANQILLFVQIMHVLTCTHFLCMWSTKCMFIKHISLLANSSIVLPPSYHIVHGYHRSPQSWIVLPPITNVFHLTTSSHHRISRNIHCWFLHATEKKISYHEGNISGGNQLLCENYGNFNLSRMMLIQLSV